MTGTPHVELGMYPFASVISAWDDLWRAVHARAPWLPDRLSWSGDVHARWRDPDCLVTHVCGAPFIAVHHLDMHLLGTFTVDLPEAGPAGFYRSVLLSPHDRSLDELVTAGTHAVANSADSLSGWLSLLAATVGAARAWPGPVTFTSAHLESVRALSRGEADLAAIDAWSLDLIGREQPDLVAPLRRVGLGPLIPMPALTARASMPAERVAELGDALRSALAAPETEHARRSLRIVGLADLGLDDYRRVLSLIPT